MVKNSNSKKKVRIKNIRRKKIIIKELSKKLKDKESDENTPNNNEEIEINKFVDFFREAGVINPGLSPNPQDSSGNLEETTTQDSRESRTQDTSQNTNEATRVYNVPYNEPAYSPSGSISYVSSEGVYEERGMAERITNEMMARQRESERGTGGLPSIARRQERRIIDATSMEMASKGLGENKSMADIEGPSSRDYTTRPLKSQEDKEKEERRRRII